MSPETLAVIGSILGAALGGGTVTAFFNFLRQRRQDKGEQTIGSFGSLERLNDRLTSQVAELQTALDEERSRRRALEDEVGELRRAGREMEDRMASLERRREDGDVV